jgi:hypothetical protein
MDIPLTDAWFHARWSWLLGTGATPWHGLSFPHMSHSAYADRPVDWALGWHWLVAPFVTLADEPIAGLRVANALFAAVLVTVFYGVLAAGGNRRPLLWTALLHLASVFWLYRIHTGRPTPLAIAGLLLLWHFGTTKRPLAVAITACVTMLLYQVPAWPALVIAVSCACLLLFERKVPWKLALAGASGVAAGIVLHPGFWDVRGGPLSLDRGTFALWQQMGKSVEFAAANGWWTFADGSRIQVPIPVEMSPARGYHLLQYLTSFAAAAAALVAAIVPRRSVRAVAATVLALVALAMTLQSFRFGEYLTPLALLAAAEGLDGAHRAPSALRRGLLFAAAGVGLLATLKFAPEVTEITSERRAREIRPAICAVETRARAGDVVWNGAWDEFANLFYEGPSLRFPQGFDPWFMMAHDERAQWAMFILRSPHHADDELRAALIGRFGARFALLWRRPERHGARDRGYDDLIARLRKVPWARVIHEDEATVVFELQ